MTELKNVFLKFFKTYFAFEADGYSIDIYREKILHLILRVSFIVVSIIVIPSAVGGIIGDVMAVFYYDIAIYFVFLILTFNKKIAFNLRVRLFTSILYLTGIIMLWLLGPQGAGFMYLYAFPVVTALLRDKKALYEALALCFGSLFILGVVIWQDWFPVGLLSSFELFAFTITAINFAALVILSSIPINLIVSFIESSYSKIQTSNTELEHQREKLKTSYSELDRFVYSISHDIRAPLTSIMGLTQLSLLESKNKIVQDYLDKINRSSHKIDVFLHQMIEFTGNKQKISTPEKLNLEALCESFLKYEEDLTGGINIQRFYDFEVKEAELDAFRVPIILENLLSNAVKYSLAKQFIEIHVSSRLVGGNLEIVVQDRGVGIAENRKEKIFTMFYRGHSYSSGSGLGLYLAKACVDALNGTITMETSNEGTTFRIALPYTPIAIG